MSNENLVETSQWNAVWDRKVSPPLPLRPWRSYVCWRFHRLFSEFIKPGDSVLEVGCGGSRFLPYFAQRLGATVAGFDYAEAGVSLSKASLAAAGVSGDIRLGDLFGEPCFPKDSFDVVWSAGFIEHFVDASDVIARMAHYVKPGGVLITEVPNMGGLVGKLQRAIDPALYAQHFVITPAKMNAAHGAAGLAPVSPAKYFGTLELGVIGYGNKVHPKILPWFNRALNVAETLLLSPLWLFRTSLESEAMSPLVIGVYKK
jgi:2-polyprenyl-3-methyl-5-hydroxy-6-metoxy-1,4-benzoquinol methylase